MKKLHCPARSSSTFYMFARLSCVAVSVAIAGCSFYKSHEFKDLTYYLYRPDYVDTAFKTYKDSPNKQVSDVDAVLFSTGVRHKLRKHMTISRFARETSSTLQVLTAAAAAALGVASGGVTPAMTALAATSAVIPQFQEIFDAKHRAEAYNQGITLIGDAESTYLTDVHGQISSAILTAAGAKLILQVNATLKLVETALAAQIPDKKSYDTAHGIISESLKLSTTFLSLSKGAKSEIAVLSQGKATVAVSENPIIATITFDSSRTNVLNVTAQQTGSTTFLIGDGSGATGTVTVKVYAPISLVSSQVVKVSVAATPTVVVKSDDEFTSATPSQKEVLEISINNDKTPREVSIKRLKSGPVNVIVQNASGAPPVTIQVVE